MQACGRRWRCGAAGGVASLGDLLSIESQPQNRAPVGRKRKPTVASVAAPRTLPAGHAHLARAAPRCVEIHQHGRLCRNQRFKLFDRQPLCHHVDRADGHPTAPLLRARQGGRAVGGGRCRRRPPRACRGGPRTGPLGPVDGGSLVCSDCAGHGGGLSWLGTPGGQDGRGGCRKPAIRMPGPLHSSGRAADVSGRELAGPAAPAAGARWCPKTLLPLRVCQCAAASG